MSSVGPVHPADRQTSALRWSYMPRRLQLASRYVLAAIWFGAAVLGAQFPARGQHIAARTETSISLSGASSGGTLTLMRVPGLGNPYAVVSNRPGETAESVASRLAFEVATCEALKNPFPRGIRVSGQAMPSPLLEAGSASLRLIGGQSAPGGGGGWMLGGSETGLGIPPAPTSLSAWFDPSSGFTTLHWVNPPGGYDRVSIVVGATPFVFVPGQTTSYELETRGGGLGSPDMTRFGGYFCVVGEKAGVPSNGVVIRANNRRVEALMNVPFSRGTAPGFTGWRFHTPSNALTFEEGRFPGAGPGVSLRSSGDGAFYQILKGSGTFQGGVCRRFLGLPRGHSYRISARMAASGGGAGAWSLSFHAAQGPVVDSEPTAAQMAGQQPLPDGRSGPAAGRIALLDSSTAREIPWSPYRSAADAPPTAPSTDVTLLPAAGDSIAVWFVLRGERVDNVTSCIDSVAIEDLGEIVK